MDIFLKGIETFYFWCIIAEQDLSKGRVLQNGEKS